MVIHSLKHVCVMVLYKMATVHCTYAQWTSMLVPVNVTFGRTVIVWKRQFARLAFSFPEPQYILLQGREK